MLLRLLKVYQDAPDGLYLLLDNFRAQELHVGPSGVHHPVTPPLSTGVVQSAVPLAVAPCTSNSSLVVLDTNLSIILVVSVPSGVCLINTCILILVFCTHFFIRDIMVENLQIYKDASELIKRVFTKPSK